MIKRKTVLILGAGASCAYGYPSGAKLRGQILDIRNTPENKERNYAVQTTAEGYEGFGRAFAESGLYSIDSFLSKQPDRRKEFYALGKRAIAFYIGRCEDPKILTERHSEKDDWYRLLWNSLAGDARTVSDVPTDLIRVVTFNYDRSLEFFLFLAARAAFALTDDEAIQFTTRFQIRHVYGNLGPLSAKQTQDGGRPYTPLKLAEDVAKAAEAIQIMERGQDTRLEEWCNWFKDCDQACFLGFGFDSLNIERLGFAQAMRERFVSNGGQIQGKGLQVFATVRGIPKARIDQIRTELLRLPPVGVTCEMSDNDIADALPMWNCLR